MNVPGPNCFRNPILVAGSPVWNANLACSTSSIRSPSISSVVLGTADVESRSTAAIFWDSTIPVPKVSGHVHRFWDITIPVP